LLLSGKELSLSTNDLVIADDKASVGLAGVMGGAKDSVLPKTTKVILEVANFNSSSIRHTAMRYEVRTEAAIRYEKGIDPERCDFAVSLAMQMFAEFFPGMSVTGFSDNYPEHLKRKEINVSLDWLEKRLGKHIPNDDIACKLERLGFKVSFAGNTMLVIVPTWRSTGDISIPDDIMEEVARLHGYENFEPTPITTTFTGAINQLDIDIDRKIREYLAFRCGMQEIFTYPWMVDEYVNALFQSNDGMLSLSVPPAPNERFVRSSLLPNLCKAIEGNLRFFNEFSIFESAQVFFNKDFKAVYDSRESLPLQRRNIAGAFVGDFNSLFRKAKGIISLLPRYAHIEPITFEKKEKPIWADGVAWLNLCHCGQKIGNLALLSKKASLDCGIKNSSAIIFEIDIDSLKPYPSRTNKFVHLPEFPITEYDISMLFDLSVKWEDIVKVIGSEDVSFVDEYRGHQVPEGKKSVTIRLVIGSPKKTLTSEEIESYAKGVMKRLQKNFGAELRN